MKKWPTKMSNLITLFVLIFVIWKQAPLVLNNYRKEGQKLKAEEFMIINPNREETKISFPPRGRVMAIFWASWCGPCKVEMARLKNSVEKGKIPEKAIFAINPFETREEVRKFITQNQYPFIFLDAPQLASLLDIQATPTTLYLEDESIVSLSSGMSLIGIWRAEHFL